MNQGQIRCGRSLSRRDFLKGALAAGAVSALAGCVAVPSGPSPAPAKPAPAKPAEVTKVTFLIWGGEAEQKAWEARRQGFLKRYPNLDVEIIFPPGNYTEKLTAMIASDTAPDTFVSNNLRCDSQRKILLPLDDLIASDPDFDKQDWFAGGLDGGKVKGVQYAIPGGLGPQVIFWNVDFFQEAGLKNPNELHDKNEWTYDRMLEYSRALNKKEGNKITRFAFLPYTQWWTYIAGFGGEPFNADYTACYMDQPKNYTPVQWYADLWLKEHVAPLQEERGEFGSWPGFRDGKYAMFISGPWQQARLADSKFRWDIAWPPLQAGGRPLMNSGGGGSVIYPKSQKIQAAFKWISYVESAEGQAVWAGLGFDLPSHPSLVKDYIAGKFFTNPKAIPPSVGLWYKVVEASLKSPHTYITAQAGDLLNQAFSKINTGAATAQKAFTEVNKDVNTALNAC